MSNTSNKTNGLSASQRILVALNEATTKLKAAEQAKTEPIAIVGMGCRFPGGANDPEAFWELLRDGVDAIAPVPKERWDIDAYYDSDPDTPGKMYTRYGGFIDRVDEFDARFFGISPREAVNLDPQQRLLLEVSWSALENGGQVPAELAGSKTGVFVGVTTNDYAKLLMPKGDLSQIDTYYLAGNPLNAVAGRVSYTLGLQGPSMAVDTACSSSLVSVHLACQSLRNRECNMALAGGVNLILSPDNTVALCRARMMSPDGRCKTFDANADGFVRGEGCGVILLKRLSDAIASEDNILALVRGSGINQDGASSGFTVPNKKAQSALISQVLTAAKVKPEEVDYIEAHGTGTSLGDPIEVKALMTVLGQSRSKALKIGSVKTNLGHLESAAGVAGLIKVILSLQKEQIPPHLHFQQPNPYLDWNKLPVEVATELTPWVRNQQRRLAGVSSFGASGTNAHILLEESPISESAATTVEHPWQLLTLSAKSEKALKELASRYEQHLANNPHQAWSDICFSSNTRRSHFQYRLCVLVQSSTDAQKQLADFGQGLEAPGIVTGTTADTAIKTAFLFTGQGSQYVGMGQQLYDTQPTFRDALNRCAEILEPYLERPLLEIIYPSASESQINQTAYTQPAIFAIEYALYCLWQSWGIKPDVVMGHSVGEYVAATIAGVFSLESGLKLIATRGRLMQALPAGGEMVAVLAPQTQVEEAIQDCQEGVAIAAINGASSIVISGQAEAVQKVVATLEATGVKTKKLEVSHAFHSPLMQPMLAEFESVARQITYSAPCLKIVSNLTGELADETITTPQYWVDHISQPVQFAQSMETLTQEGYRVFVEIGSQPILLGMGRRCLNGLQEAQSLWLPSLRRKKSDWQQMLSSLSELYLQGAKIDWTGLAKDYGYQAVALPTYPFQRQRYWTNATQNGSDQSSIPNDLIKLLGDDPQQLAQQIVASERLSAAEAQTLPKLLQIIGEFQQQQQATASLSEWLYEVEWQSQPRQKSKSQLDGKWLIFADQTGVGQSLAQILQQQGQDCITVYAGDAYEVNNDSWTINPNRAEDFKQLLQEIPVSNFNVLHLWSLDIPTVTELNCDRLAASQMLGCGSTLHLLQALSQQAIQRGLASQRVAGVPPVVATDEGGGFPHERYASRYTISEGVSFRTRVQRPLGLNQEISSAKLWLVTREAVSINNSALSGVGQAPIWGLGKVIALEHPELWGGIIDIDADLTSELAEQILIETTVTGERVALRKERYVARLAHSKSILEPKVSIQSDATYLITGGLGALGLKVAQWLGSQGAKNIVLTSRSKASGEKAQTLEQIKSMGVNLVLAQADVSSEAEMTLLLENIQSLPPLKGIFHAAGVLEDRLLLEQDWASFERVMAAKVTGAWVLHSLTDQLPLDYFVLFSSAASLFGSPAQGNYAAANSFLDALAHHRRSQKLPGLSINWGPWSQSGMAADLAQNDRTRIESRGMKSIPPELGMKALSSLLGQNAAQVGVLPIDWDKFLQQFPKDNIPTFLESFAITQQSSESESFLQQLSTTAVSDRQNLLIARIRSQIARSMGLDAADVDTKMGFADLGMDSLMAVELRNYLQNILERSIPASLVFDYPNVEALAEYFIQEIFDKSNDESNLLLEEPEAPEAKSNLEDIDDISDEEAEAMLLGKLDSMRY